MSEQLTRRTFLTSATVASVAVSTLAARDQKTIQLAVVGCGGRGNDLGKLFSKIPQVVISHACDPDENRAKKLADDLKKLTGAEEGPKVVSDFRTILSEKNLDGILVATPNHWHAPAGILACAHGKHAYVEKPCSHNPREGELLVQAARKYKCHVQMGNQRRSYPKIIEAMQRLHKGDLGRVYAAKCWYFNARPSIGKGQATEIPKGLDYALWEGPAPHKEFRSNFLHYNWHWFWNWGNGELGNNGIHMIDLCRWGLQVDYPEKVTSTGGRYHFDDDQETPDTQIVTFDFPNKKTITWEGQSCVMHPVSQPADVIFYGEKGSLMIRGSGYSIHDLRGKEIEKVAGTDGMLAHATNFIEAIRGSATLNSEILEGHKSTLLCHLGNIAHRVGHALQCDPRDGKIKDDAKAMQLWSRDYTKGFEPTV